MTQANLEVLLAKLTADLVERGFDSATVAAAFLRASAQMASLKGVSAEEFVTVARTAFRTIEASDTRCFQCGKLWETECNCSMPDPTADPDGYAEHIARDRRRSA